ncbi:MAG: transposase [Dehalococcoidia bacterium]|nr:transposase [Dehalococcoidia bacterium]
MSDPLAFLITFRCYGSWLHGDPRGSMDRDNRDFGEPCVAPSPARNAWERNRLKNAPRSLQGAERDAAAAAIEEVCAVRGWGLLALNVRTNHIHAVVGAETSPEQIMVTFKAWTTRRLRALGMAGSDERLWSRHGSTRYLWNDDAVAAAIGYVLYQQDGERYELGP